MTRFPPLLTPRVASYYVVAVLMKQCCAVGGVILPWARLAPWIREKSLPIKAILVFRLSTRVSVIWISEWMNMTENDHTPIPETIHPPAYPAGLELIPVEDERMTGGRHETFDLHAGCWKCGHIMRLYILGPDNGGGGDLTQNEMPLKEAIIE